MHSNSGIFSHDLLYCTPVTREGGLVGIDQHIHDE